LYLKIIKTKKSSVRNCKFCLQDYKCCQLPCSIYQEAKRGTIGQLYIYYKNAKICERTQRALHVHKVFVNEVVKSISRILNLFPFHLVTSSRFMFKVSIRLMCVIFSCVKQDIHLKCVKQLMHLKCSLSTFFNIYCIWHEKGR
jgi:hypothetical protein